MMPQGVPLYAHIAELAGSKKPYVLPVPFMNVINGGMSSRNLPEHDDWVDC